MAPGRQVFHPRPTRRPPASTRIRRNSILKPTRRVGRAGGGIISGVATSTAQHYAGNQSLAVNFNGTAAGSSSVSVGNVVVSAGTTITFHVWIPSGSKITTLQPYLQDNNWAWTSSWYGSFTPTPGTRLP